MALNQFINALSNRHHLIMKVLLLLSALVLISMLFPHEQQFSFRYKEGKVWNYRSYRAPFDFPVQKAKEDLEAEEETVSRSSPLCFHLDESLLQVKTERLNDLLESKEALASFNLQGLNANDKKALHQRAEDLLSTIYNIGILAENDEPAWRAASEAGNGLLIIRENGTEALRGMAEERAIDKIYSLAEAKKYMDEHLRDIASEQRGSYLDLLSTLLQSNATYDDALTRKLLQENIAAISTTEGLFHKDDLIISKGEKVSPKSRRILDSVKYEYDIHYPAGDRFVYILGHMLLTAIALTMLLLFLASFRKDVFEDNKKVLFLLMLITLMIFGFYWIMKTEKLSIYLIPLCIVPVVIRAFFDTRMALFTHLIMILILGFIAQDGFEFAFMHITAGMVAIFSIANLRNRSQFFITSALLFLTYALSYIAIQIMHEGDLHNIDFLELRWFGVNSMLVLLAYPFIYLSEKIFGFVSDVSLLELSDSNSPLLRELATRAPGTFQHSLQVSNLSEAVIYKIGGNTLMIRAAALYHDIGKMEMPLYFIENQGGALNPHDELSFEESANMIISHVIRGIEIAKKHKLPDQLIDFIRTHHGTTRVQYFYKSFLKNFPDEIVDEQKFRYPGPLPYSKETAVLMMADSVEAAARSLKQPDEESIEKLVDQVIDNIIAEKQFVNCNITFRDIATAKKIFRKMLASIHHVRVEYPK